MVVVLHDEQAFDHIAAQFDQVARWPPIRRHRWGSCGACLRACWASLATFTAPEMNNRLSVGTGRSAWADQEENDDGTFPESDGWPPARRCNHVYGSVSNSPVGVEQSVGEPRTQ